MWRFSTAVWTDGITYACSNVSVQFGGAKSRAWRDYLTGRPHDVPLFKIKSSSHERVCRDPGRCEVQRAMPDSDFVVAGRTFVTAGVGADSDDVGVVGAEHTAWSGSRRTGERLHRRYQKQRHQEVERVEPTGDDIGVVRAVGSL